MLALRSELQQELQPFVMTKTTPEVPEDVTAAQTAAWRQVAIAEQD